MEKLKFEDYVEKYFEELTHDTWTSVYERVEIGFTLSDLSHYSKSDLEKRYQKYLDDTETFLEYEE